MKYRRICNLNNLLLFVLLFFGLFDVARNYTKLPISFGYVKDAVIYILFIFNIRKLCLPRFLGKTFYVWALAVLVFSPIGFLNSNYDFSSILIACLKFPEIFVLIILFTNWNSIFSIQLNRFINWYVIGSIVLCFVNIIGYFIDNPIVSVKLANANMPAGHYGGRITVGQPPLAVFPILLSSVYLLINSKDLKGRLIFTFLLFCVFISTSNTGLLSVLVVLLILIFIRDKNIRRNILFCVAFCCLGIFVIFVFAPDFIGKIFELFINKIGQYLGDGSDPSMDIRHIHWKNGYDTLSDLDFLFGRGVYGYIVKDYYPIENTFVSTFLMYGLIGVIAMVLFFIRLMHSAIKRGINNKNKCILLFCVCIVFICHIYTLDLYFCYTLYFSLALFIGYCFVDDSKDEVKRHSLLNLEAKTTVACSCTM